MANKIQLRRDTAANWTSTNPTLSQGEQGYETDTGKIKIGDGSTAWTSLGYSFEGGSPDLYADNYDGTSTLPSATGTNAVALNVQAEATGSYATALGFDAVASGSFSTATGQGSNAGSSRSVALGFQATTATGSNAAAIGKSYASGTDSFAAAIGNNTSSYGATGSNSIAMGLQAKANSTNGISIGSSTQAAYQALAIGTFSTATASQSAALGYANTASHANAVTIGSNVQSTTTNEVSIGGTADTVRISESYTLPTSDGTNGQVLTTDGSGAVTFADAGGGGASEYTIDNKTAAYTVVSGDLGKILNYTSGTVDVTLTALSSLTTGFHVSIWNSGTGVISIKPNSVDGIGVSAGNDYDSSDPLKLEMGTGVTLVNSGTYWQIYSEKAYDYYHHSVTLGANAKASNNYAMALGNGSSASSVGAIAIGTGQGSATTASNSHAVAIGLSTASGANSVALGNSYASGSHSFAAAIANNTSSYGATGANSVAIGQIARAISANTVALGGTFTYASGSNSVSIGKDATTFGARCFALNGGIATSADSMAIGNHAATKTVIGHIAMSGGFRFSAGGDSQQGTFILRSDTTDATSEALTTNNSTAGTTNQVILPNNSAYSFSGTIIARESAAAGSDYASWEIKGALLRDANAASTVLGNGIKNKLYASAGASAWDIALTADTTNGGLAITVTGAASTNIRWVATVNTSEVTYA